MRQMKDSGVEWIGEIPENWNTIKIKYTSWLKGRIGWDGLKSTEYTDEGAYLITGINFDRGVIDWDSCVHISEQRFWEDSDIHIQEDDLLITKDGTVGKVAIAKNCPEMVSLNSGVLLIRNIYEYKYHDKYLYYVLSSDVFWRWYTLSQTGQSTIKHLYQEQFYDFEFTYPSLSEQISIASYLDNKCALIDNIIEKTKVSIEEYKKLKQAIITQAIVKGIDGERHFYDSGNSLIGEIASDRKVTKVKYIASKVTDGAHVSPEYDDNGYEYISTVNISNGKIVFDGCIKTSKNSYEIFVRTGCQPHKDDVLISKDGSVGKTVIIDYEREFVVGSSLVIISPIQQLISSEYLNYNLQSDFVQTQLFMVMHGTALKRVSVEKNANLPIVMVDKEKQKRIVEYLNQKCAKIVDLINQKESFLIELESYKKSLIYEYVTGKKEVPSA